MHRIGLDVYHCVFPLSCTLEAFCVLYSLNWVFLSLHSIRENGKQTNSAEFFMLKNRSKPILSSTEPIVALLLISHVFHQYISSKFQSIQAFYWEIKRIFQPMKITVISSRQWILYDIGYHYNLWKISKAKTLEIKYF